MVIDGLNVDGYRWDMKRWSRRSPHPDAIKSENGWHYEIVMAAPDRQETKWDFRKSGWIYIHDPGYYYKKELISVQTSENRSGLSTFIFNMSYHFRDPKQGFLDEVEGLLPADR